MSKIDMLTEPKAPQATPSGVLLQSVARWFAVYTAPRHEKRVSEHFRTRDIESFLPLYRTVHRWNNGTRVPLELPLFPGYIFVRLDPRARVRVLEVPGVAYMVGSARAPEPLSDFEIESLRSGLHLCKVEPHPYLRIGERVRIIAGPLAGMEGVLTRRRNNFRVVLTLELIMQSVAVEVDAADLEPVRSSTKFC